MATKPSFLLRLTAVAVLLIRLSASAAGEESLGKIDFPNSGAEAAQPAFIRGVLLLHSFEYDDARLAFQEARTIDPDFALAYWGEAMTHNHPLWRRQNREAAQAVLGKLAASSEERRAKAPTERERGYLEAVEVLYGAGDKVARDLAYAESMRRLAERFPEDLEAKSFYALSILGTTQGVRDFRTYMRAGALVEEVFAANPEHPGAAHYLIHSYDDPVHAPLGLRAARVYAQIAPAASHAQHMISHIYVALGRWQESVASNVKSFEVSQQRVARQDLEIDALNFHSLHWLEYSYLQLGQFENARQLLDQMRAYAEESGSERARGYYAAMRATWLVETGGRDAPESLGTRNMGPTSAAGDLFASGLSALSAGDQAAAGAALEQLTAARQAATPRHEDASGSVSAERFTVIQVMEQSLEAQQALLQGRHDRAQALLEEATALEGARPLEYGPPSIVKPSHELFGEALLQLDRPEDAAAQFRIALERAPRRRLSLAGLAAAASASGDDTTLASVCAELGAILAAADGAVERPAACGS